MIVKPTYASIWLCSINTAVAPTPSTPGSSDSAYSHHPQHPNGTSEKNEKNDVAAVLPPFIECLFFILHPIFFPFSDMYICSPMPIPMPIIIILFRWNAALIASNGESAGVVRMTMDR